MTFKCAINIRYVPTATMFLLVLVMTSICGLGEATLFQTHPVDTLALPGGNVSFSCTPISELCGGRPIVLWQRGREKIPRENRNIYTGNGMSRDFTGRERYTMSVSNCTWTLHIVDIQPVDEKYYSCYIINGYSNLARLTTGKLDTTVLPTRIDRYAGENAYFSCHTRPLYQHGLEYTWDVKTLESPKWEELLENYTRIKFHNNKTTMTMLSWD